MTCTCVVGLQWGDEAKGKIVDILGHDHDFVVRYNGGANAGHTVVKDGKTYKLSLLPTGILSPHLTAVIGNGLVVNPVRFLEEVDNLRTSGVAVSGANLILSDHAHLIFPYHMEEERQGGQGSEQTIGTTGRGIGPCYMDKVGRMNGVRVGELLHPDHFRERLRIIVPRKNVLMQAFSPGVGGTAFPGRPDGLGSPSHLKPFDADALCDEYLGYARQLAPFIRDSARVLHEALKAGKRILFEAAQGSLLDVDHGTYPYVTSSNSSTTGIWSGSGVPARNLSRIIGVIKAYTTRVGRGPFPTQLDDGPAGIGERIRKAGNEYGTVTGRPRRCGWFDAVAVRHTATLGDADALAVMLLDVLSGLDELKICTAYELNGKRIDYFPADAFLLEKCRPVYETMPGWKGDVTGARKLADLPTAARKYVDRICAILDLPAAFMSVGPDREQTILC